MNDKSGFWFGHRGRNGEEISHYIPAGGYTHVELIDRFTQFLRGCGYSINGDYRLEETDERTSND